jgi:glycosyltransferase involved in cell wall biosynthesis
MSLPFRSEQKKEKVSVIMPAYNESKRIINSIEITAKTFNEFPYAWELIVIDDGSTDDTFNKVKLLEDKFSGHVILRKNPYNIGKGRAIKKAMHYATGDYIVFLDADMDLHPIQVETLFNIMKLVNADVVIGSKLHPNSIVHYPLQRKIISKIYYLFIRMLFNLPCHDTQTGLKLFKTDVLRKVFPRILVKQFAFDLEILVNAAHMGFKIAEAPVVITSQRKYSRIGVNAVYTTLIDTLAIFYRMHILHYYDRIDYHRRKNMAQEFRKLRK